MSAFLGIKLYAELIHDCDFFARCIIGLLYQDDSNCEAQIKNSFIKLLNSSCIDVDKIDYLLRDAYVTGFDTISIDYVRLLKSVVIKKYKCENEDATSTEKYKLSFNKRAVSVLENVVYAHDSELKWIQNHPVVLYEGFIIKHAIESVLNYYKKQNLDIFSYEALLEQGITNDKGYKVSLICDDDFIHTMKNCISDDLVEEYFNRKMRRHPVWKSESEYMAFFGKKGEWTSEFNKSMSYLEKFLTEEAKSIVNDGVIDLLNDKIGLIKNENISETDKSVQLERYERILAIVKKLKNVAEKMEIEYNFVIIKSGVFSSGFSKRAIKDVLIDFPNCNKEVTLESVTTLLDAEEKENKNFYYIFYKRNKPMDSSIFAKTLYGQFND